MLMGVMLSSLWFVPPPLPPDPLPGDPDDFGTPKAQGVCGLMTTEKNLHIKLFCLSHRVVYFKDKNMGFRAGGGVLQVE
jgi:hypothetical protein